MAEDLVERVETMKREIDALQIAFLSQKKKPWYKEIPVIVSVAALLFSFGTTFVSYRRTEVQDVQNLRQELRGLLQRLAALPKENLEATKQYAGDPAAINIISSYLNQENEILARQSAEITRRLPKDTVTSTEYYAIGVAMGNSYDLQNEKAFLKLSEDTAKDFNTEVAAERSLGNVDFIMGQAGEGRVEYQKALNIFSKYPGYDPFTMAGSNILTELAWATSEAALGARPEASQHIESAQRLADSLPPSQGADMLKAQVGQSRTQFERGAVSATPGISPQLPTTPPKNH